MLGPRKPWPVPAAALTPGSPRVGTRPLSWGSLLGPPTWLSWYRPAAPRPLLSGGPRRWPHTGPVAWGRQRHWPHTAVEARLLCQELGFIFPAGVWLLRGVTPRMKLGPRGLASLLRPPSPLPFTAHPPCARHFSLGISCYLRSSPETRVLTPSVPVQMSGRAGLSDPPRFPRRPQGVLLGESAPRCWPW